MTDKYYGVWKMQDWKMTDKILAISDQNYGLWKMQDLLTWLCVCTVDVYLANLNV